MSKGDSEPTHIPKASYKTSCLRGHRFGLALNTLAEQERAHYQAAYIRGHVRRANMFTEYSDLSGRGELYWGLWDKRLFNQHMS